MGFANALFDSRWGCDLGVLCVLCLGGASHVTSST